MEETIIRGKIEFYVARDEKGGITRAKTLDGKFEVEYVDRPEFPASKWEVWRIDGDAEGIKPHLWDVCKSFTLAAKAIHKAIIEEKYPLKSSAQAWRKYDEAMDKVVVHRDWRLKRAQMISKADRIREEREAKTEFAVASGKLWEQVVEDLELVRERAEFLR